MTNVVATSSLRKKKGDAGSQMLSELRKVRVSIFSLARAF